MPTTIRVMSWNVQNLGDSKTSLPGPAFTPDMRVVNLIANEVFRRGIRVLGIMEIQSGIGNAVGQHIINELNNKPGSSKQWTARLSSRQDGGTQEEYLFIVDFGVGNIRFDVTGRPAQSSLMGVFDESVINDFGTNPSERQQLMDALNDTNYIKRANFYVSKGGMKVQMTTSQYRVEGQAWSDLSAGASVKFPSPQKPFVAGLTALQLLQLKKKILDVDILKFTSPGDRSPFMMHLKIGSNNNLTPLTIVLAHQLGTSDPQRFDAINIMALNRVLLYNAANSSPMLLMGDYNVATSQMKKQVRVYERRIANHVFGLNTATPPTTQQIFSPLFDWSKTNVDLLGAQATSLNHSFLMNNAPAADALSSAYDKLMLFNVPTAKIGDSGVVNLVSEYTKPKNAVQSTAKLALARAKAVGISDFITEKQEKLEDRISAISKKNVGIMKSIKELQKKITAHTPQSSPLRKRLAKFKAERNTYGEIEDGLQTQVDAAELILQQLATATVTYPKDIGTSLAVYSYAVSDHLPVAVEFTLG